MYRGYIGYIVGIGYIDGVGCIVGVGIFGSEVSFVSEVSVIRIFGTVRLTVYIRCFVGVVSRITSRIHGFETYSIITFSQISNSSSGPYMSEQGLYGAGCMPLKPDRREARADLVRGEASRLARSHRAQLRCELWIGVM